MESYVVDIEVRRQVTKFDAERAVWREDVVDEPQTVKILAPSADQAERVARMRFEAVRVTRVVRALELRSDAA